MQPSKICARVNGFLCFLPFEKNTKYQKADVAHDEWNKKKFKSGREILEGRAFHNFFFLFVYSQMGGNSINKAVKSLFDKKKKIYLMWVVFLNFV